MILVDLRSMVLDYFGRYRYKYQRSFLIWDQWSLITLGLWVILSLVLHSAKPSIVLSLRSERSSATCPFWWMVQMNCGLRAFRSSGFSHMSFFQSGYPPKWRISCHVSTLINGLDLLLLFGVSMVWALSCHITKCLKCHITIMSHQWFGVTHLSPHNSFDADT